MHLFLQRREKRSSRRRQKPKFVINPKMVVRRALESDTVKYGATE